MTNQVVEGVIILKSLSNLSCAMDLNSGCKSWPIGQSNYEVMCNKSIEIHSDVKNRILVQN